MSQFIEGQPLGIIAEAKRGLCVTACQGLKALKYALIPFLLSLFVSGIYEYFVRASAPNTEMVLPEIILSVISILTSVYLTVYLYRYFLTENTDSANRVAMLRFGKEEGQYFKWCLYVYLMMALIGLGFVIIYALIVAAMIMGGELIGLKYSIVESINTVAASPQFDMYEDHSKSITFMDPSRVGDWLLVSISLFYWSAFAAFIATRYAFLFTSAVQGVETTVSSAKQLVSKQFKPLFVISIFYFGVIFLISKIFRVFFDKGEVGYYLSVGVEYLLLFFLSVFGAYIATRYYQRALDAQ